MEFGNIVIDRKSFINAGGFYDFRCSLSGTDYMSLLRNGIEKMRCNGDDLNLILKDFLFWK